MADIKLSSAIRSNLLSLQQTSSLVAQTQGRLSTGLKVGSAIDDATAFFQAKALSDRASDLSGKKDGIDQGISSLSTALKAMEAVEDVLKQMKGVLLSAKSSTADERATLGKQLKELAAQVNNLVDDASYQGLNLVSASSTSLSVSFSDKTGSTLAVSGFNANVSHLTGLGGISAAGVASTISSFGGEGVSGGLSLISAASAVTLIDGALDAFDSAITAVRSNAKTLGSNVALLKTRLDFTTGYVNTLQSGADKLTLADLNEEGANLVSLQTRQALATQALAFAGQVEQSVLQLFG
jgi:flagellin-like hook-associated protein FlgL